MAATGTADQETSSIRSTVDVLLSNVSDFIEGVYRDVLLTPPPAASPRYSRYRSHQPETPSPSSISSISMGNSLLFSSPDSELNDNIVVASSSPVRRLQIEADIERINRICDNVDENLRLYGLSSNGRGRGERAAADTGAGSLLNYRQQSNAATSNDNDIADSIVDLCETQTETPEALRPQRMIENPNSSYDDDEVVVVASNLPPIIDLCSPGGGSFLSRPSAPLQRRHLIRPSLEPTSPTDEVPIRRRRLSIRDTIATKPPEKTKSIDSIANEHSTNKDDNSKGSDTAENERLKCPICMDVRNRPTTTKCGHVFCEGCIRQAIRITRKCPLCNMKNTEKQLLRIYF